jgi:D-alanine-D-alanine ligase
MKRYTTIKRRFARKRIGVLMGGWSGERPVSLRSGQNVLAALKRQGLTAVGVDVGRDVAQVLVRQKIQAAFVILHGPFGEDGTIQGMLEMMGIPYTGSGVLASALAMHKGYSKKIFQESGIPTPNFCWVGQDQEQKIDAPHCLEMLGLPVVLKPAAEGSSLGVSIAKTPEQAEKGVKSLLRKYGEAIVERYVPGMAVTTGVLGTGDKARALPVLELVSKNEFYDYQAKYTPGLTEFHVPARLPGAVYRKVQETAVLAHRVLGCRGWSRVDAIVDRAGTPFVLEVNTLPGMTNLSDLPAEAQAEDMSYDQLVLEILDSALTRNI